MQVAFDGARAHAEGGSDLVDCQVFVESEHDALPLPKWQLANRVAQCLVGIAVFAVLSCGASANIGVPTFEHSSSQQTVAAIDHRSAQVRIERISVAQMRWPRDELYEDVLDDLLGKGTTADEPARQANKVSGARSIQLLDVVLIHGVFVPKAIPLTVRRRTSGRERLPVNQILAIGIGATVSTLSPS